MPKCPHCDCIVFLLGTIKPVGSMVNWEILYCRDCERILSTFQPLDLSG